MYDLNAIRADFGALSTPDAAGQLPLFLDAPGGTQVPQVVLDAMVGYLGHYNNNFGGFADAGVQTSKTVLDARQAAADLLGASPASVFFGQNSTSLMMAVSRAVARTWQAGDNIVVTDLDHFSNVSSWALAAADAGAEVRTLRLDADGRDLDYAALGVLIDDRTQLVAVTAASNTLGTLPDVPRVIAAAHAVGALVSVDAVHGAVHVPQRFDELGTDFLFSSAYKLGGPHLGIGCMRAELTTSLSPYKVEPASDEAPGRWETGTQSFEAMAGLIALADYWASLGEGPTRRERIVDAYRTIWAHERTLIEATLAEFATRPRLRLYGRPGVDGRTPTFGFNIVDATGAAVCGRPLAAWMGERNVALGWGNFYALGAVRALGIEDEGVLRAGYAHYNTLDEVARFFSLLDEGIEACGL